MSAPARSQLEELGLSTTCAEVLHHLWDYLALKKIHWFVDWPWYVEKTLGSDPAAHGWKQVAARDNFLLYRRDTP